MNDFYSEVNGVNEMLKRVQSIAKKIKEHSRVMAIYLFGSYAKGEEKPISDIDIAVVLKDPDPESEADIGSLYSGKLDVVLFHRLPLYMKFEVLKFGKEIFIRDEEFVLELKRRVLSEYLENSWLYSRISEGLWR